MTFVFTLILVWLKVLTLITFIFILPTLIFSYASIKIFAWIFPCGERIRRNRR